MDPSGAAQVSDSRVALGVPTILRPAAAAAATGIPVDMGTTVHRRESPPCRLHPD